MKQKKHDLRGQLAYTPDNDPLELKRYVDLILKEIENQDQKKLKFGRGSYRKKNFQKENAEIRLREIPFVF